MRKLMWLLPAVALWIAPPALAQGPFGRPYGPRSGPLVPGVPDVGDPFGRQSGIPGLPGQFGRPRGPRFGPVIPGVPDVGDPFGRQSGIPGLPGQFDPFGRPRSAGPNLDPFNPLGRPAGPGLPGHRFGQPWDLPGRPGGTARFFDPTRRYSPLDPLPSDPANPLGLPGRNIGPGTSRPGLPRLQAPPPVDLGSLMPSIKSPQLDFKPYSMPQTTLPGLERSGPSADTHSFDPSWWPWLFGAAGVAFVVSLIAGYASGRCHA